jgi:hypothetical protein
MAEQIVVCPYCMPGDQRGPNAAATGMVHLRTVRPRSDSRRSRFQVLLPQLPEGEAGCLIAKW